MQLHAEIRWPVNLKQMYDQQIRLACRVTNGGPIYGPLFMLFRSQQIKRHKSVGVLIVCHCLSSLSWRNKWRVPWSNDFIGRFSLATKPRPQKLANFIDRLTASLILQVLATCVFLLLTRRFGRRTLLLAGTTLMLVGTICLGALIRAVFHDPVIADGCRAGAAVSGNITTPVYDHYSTTPR